MTSARATGAVALTSAAMMVGLMSTSGGAHPTGAVTWSTVSSVLEQRCLSCHGPGGSAAPRLDGYDNARLAAADMKRAVLERRMPPWYAVEGFGDFANDPTLTPTEIAWIADWADGGAPADVGDESPTDEPSGVDLPRDEASGANLPPAPRLRRTAEALRESGYGPRGPGRDKRADEPPVEAGSHDRGAHAHMYHPREEELVLRVPASPVDQPQRTFELRTGLTRDRWVRGWELRPGTAALVLGATISIAPDTPLGSWMAGDAKTTLPEDVAARLPRGSVILLTLKYRRTTDRTPDESVLRLVLSDAPARELQTMSLPCGTSRIPHDVDALAVRAGGAAAGESLTVEARRPDRTVEPIAWFRNYPRPHDRTYWFRHSVPLPAGTALTVAASGEHCGASLEYVRR